MSAGAAISSPEGVPKLLAAFHKTLAAIEVVRKSQEADTGKYKYTYADLADVLAEAKVRALANEITISQNVETHGDQVMVVTTLLHSSGEWMSLPGLGMPAPRDPQALGGILTYLRRYALVAIFSMPTEDDDGQAAANQQRRIDSTGHRTGAEERVHKELAAEHGRDPAKAKLIRDSFREYFGCGMSDLIPSRHGEALEFVLAAIRAEEGAPIAERAADAADEAWKDAADSAGYSGS